MRKIGGSRVRRYILLAGPRSLIDAARKFFLHKGIRISLDLRHVKEIEELHLEGANFADHDGLSLSLSRWTVQEACGQVE